MLKCEGTYRGVKYTSFYHNGDKKCSGFVNFNLHGAEVTKEFVGEISPIIFVRKTIDTFVGPIGEDEQWDAKEPPVRGEAQYQKVIKAILDRVDGSVPLDDDGLARLLVDIRNTSTRAKSIKFSLIKQIKALDNNNSVFDLALWLSDNNPSVTVKLKPLAVFIGGNYV